PSDKLTFVFGHGSDEKKFTLEEICAEILRSLKESAESYLDTTKDGIITVKAVRSDTHMGGEELDKAMHEGIDFLIKFTRANFTRLNRSFFGKCIEHAESCLLNGHMHKKGIDNVVLVGGSTGIPKVKQMLTEILGGIGKQLVQDLLLLDAAPLSLGIGHVGDIMSVVIPRNKIREKRFLNTSELDGIPLDRAGAQKLKVSFQVSAVVKCNGNKRSLTIAKSGN
ncbi:heat shock cognate 70 kDa protein-like protein, partial [Tanacetum coccineum]